MLDGSESLHNQNNQVQKLIARDNEIQTFSEFSFNLLRFLSRDRIMCSTPPLSRLCVGRNKKKKSKTLEEDKTQNFWHMIRKSPSELCFYDPKKIHINPRQKLHNSSIKKRKQIRLNFSSHISAAYLVVHAHSLTRSLCLLFFVYSFTFSSFVSNWDCL